MSADLHGAVRIARIAAEFDWTWTRRDVRRLCEVTGWREVSRSDLLVSLETDLDVPEPVSYVFTGLHRVPALRKAGQDIEFISAYVATSPVGAQPPADAEVAEHYSRVRDSLAAGLGSPTWHTSGLEIETAWELPQVVISLTPLTGAVNLVFNGPLYQRWLDQLRDDQDEEDQNGWDEDDE